MAMKLSTLVFRTMWKNSRLYGLYFLALIFSSGLYFSFLTLAANPSVVEMNSTSMKAGAAFETGSVILVVIVFFFVLYANQLFMKHRSKEFGLYQLIGLPKGRIARMLLLENSVMWLIAVAVGVGMGAIFSRFFALLFLKVVEVERSVTVEFSLDALVQTALIFVILFIVMYLQSLLHMSRTKLIDLFHTSGKAEQRVKRFSWISMIIGFMGIGLIILGYYLSTQLLTSDKFNTENALYVGMLTILGSVIIGTYIFFRFSVSALLNVQRKARQGHVKIVDIVAISPIMHRMKTNSLSLSLITTLTALALAVLTLSYIAYTSADTRAKENMPFDIGTITEQAVQLEKEFDKASIEYDKHTFTILETNFDLKNAYSREIPDILQDDTMSLLVVKEGQVKSMMPDLILNDDEVAVFNYAKMTDFFMPLEKNKKIELVDLKQKATITMIEERFVLPSMLSYGSPIMVVSDSMFNEIKKHTTELPSIQSFTGFDIKDEQQLEKAQDIYMDTTNGMATVGKGEDSYELNFSTQQQEYQVFLETMGIIIFVAGFLGLAFLLTTGSILYFKQMSEAEDEAPQFTMLRKIGFTEQELMKGVSYKQLFNFGFPLLIGIFHSYFAVKAGWIMFGIGFEKPFMTVLAVYIVLYLVFALLTLRYYRKIITKSL